MKLFVGEKAPNRTFQSEESSSSSQFFKRIVVMAVFIVTLFLFLVIILLKTEKVLSIGALITIMVKKSLAILDRIGNRISLVLH